MKSRFAGLALGLMATTLASSAQAASLHFVSSPQIAGQLQATAVIADNDIWAVGFSDQVSAPPVVDSTLAEHFDGTSWSIVPTPPLPSGNAQLQGVAGAASNDVWAIGFSPSRTLVEHWDGTSWSIDSSTVFTNVGVAAIFAHARNDVWGVGANGSNAGVVHWDGTSWSIVSSPAFTGVSLSAVSADASTDVWAVGTASTIFGAPFSGPAVLHFDGTGWSLIDPTTSVPLDIASVTAVSPTDVWAVGTVSAFCTRITRRSGKQPSSTGMARAGASSQAPIRPRVRVWPAVCVGSRLSRPTTSGRSALTPPASVVGTPWPSTGMARAGRSSAAQTRAIS